MPENIGFADPAPALVELATAKGCRMDERALRGIEVTHETLSYDVIREAVEGAGHFLGSGQTLELMHSEYVYPSLADRSARRRPGGRRQARAPRPGARVREILSQHCPAYIDVKTDAAIPERFPIRLPLAAMQAESRRR